MFEFLKRNFEFVKKILETPWESPKRALKYFYFPRKRGEVYREYPKIVLFSRVLECSRKASPEILKISMR